MSRRAQARGEIMIYENNSTYIRRELLIRVSKLMFDGRLVEEIDRMPIEMIPKDQKNLRCCIYKDRQIIRYRLMAVMGHAVEQEGDEHTPLSEYARRALVRKVVKGPVQTVIDEACSACVQVKYFVTNACRGCMARPCTFNCPKKAISMQNGQARIDTALCVNCGVCQKVCPYHAVIYVPVPCEEACPVAAIQKNGTGKEEIDYTLCTFCGKCSRECPFGAIMERSQIVDVIKALKDNKRPVVALAAPAVAGQFPADLDRIFGAIQALGFSDVMEVALGADITAEKETVEFQERMRRGDKFMTSSCCPVYFETVKKHVKEMEPFVSETRSPMYYTAQLCREKYPDAVKVFVGPCLAKRHEAIVSGCVDYTITFEELGAMLVAKGIDVAQAQRKEFANPAGGNGRGFAVSGGVMEAVKSIAAKSSATVQAAVMDGITKQSLKALKAYAVNGCSSQFLEVMSCQGGCVAGPGVVSTAKFAAAKVKNLVQNQK